MCRVERRLFKSRLGRRARREKECDAIWRSTQDSATFNDVQSSVLNAATKLEEEVEKKEEEEQEEEEDDDKEEEEKEEEECSKSMTNRNWSTQQQR